jgi:hypothetical protein
MGSRGSLLVNWGLKNSGAGFVNRFNAADAGGMSTFALEIHLSSVTCGDSLEAAHSIAERRGEGDGKG